MFWTDRATVRMDTSHKIHLYIEIRENELTMWFFGFLRFTAFSFDFFSSEVKFQSKAKQIEFDSDLDEHKCCALWNSIHKHKKMKYTKTNTIHSFSNLNFTEILYKQMSYEGIIDYNKKRTKQIKFEVMKEKQNPERKLCKNFMQFAYILGITRKKTATPCCVVLVFIKNIWIICDSCSHFFCDIWSFNFSFDSNFLFFCVLILSLSLLVCALKNSIWWHFCHFQSENKWTPRSKSYLRKWTSISSIDERDILQSFINSFNECHSLRCYSCIQYNRKRQRDSENERSQKNELETLIQFP